MTAPAAAQIQRHTRTSAPLREAVQPARAGTPNASFAAHLERGTPPRPADRQRPQAPVRGALDAPRPATARPARIEAQRPAAPAETAATGTEPGKTLPDKRQTPAGATAHVVRNRLETQPMTATDEIAATEAAPETPAITADTAANSLPALALLLAAQAAPDTRPAPKFAAPGSAGQTGALVQTAKGQTAKGQAALGQSTPAAANGAASGLVPASAAAPAVSAPIAAFVLERVGPVAEAAGALPAQPAQVQPAQVLPSQAEPNPGTQQAAARAEPSTLATLTGTQEPARAALHKDRMDSERLLAGTASPAADTAAAALALAPPANGPAGVLPGAGDPAGAGAAASARPAEGIGFDALVDSIARARDGLADGAPVAVAMRHAEFGHISLRFHTDADGMSVAMTSPDPAFAPAVAAAHAAEAAAAAMTAAAMTESEPAARSQQNAAAPGGGGDLAGSQAQGGARQNRDGQPQPRAFEDPARSGLSHGPAHGPAHGQRGGETPAAGSRSGIFA